MNRSAPTDNLPHVSQAPGQDEHRPQRTDGSPTAGYAFLTGAAYGVIFLFGVVSGTLGAFHYELLDVALGSGRIPFGAAILAIAVGVACWLAGRAMTTRLGAVLLGIGWLAVTILFATQRPEGDLAVTGTAPGYVYLYGGLMLAMIGVALAPGSQPSAFR